MTIKFEFLLNIVSEARCSNIKWSPVLCAGKVPIRPVTGMLLQFLTGSLPASAIGGRDKKLGDEARFSQVLAPTNHPGLS